MIYKKIKVLSIFLILIAVFLMAPKSASAVGGFTGKVYMNYQGRQFPLKDVMVDKFRKCDPNNPEPCLKQTDPEKVQPYYTRDDGTYRMTEDDPTLFLPQLNQRRNYCDGDTSTYVRFGCGINCGENPHFLRARFSENFDTRNFPSGVDLRKGNWKVHINVDFLETKIYKDRNNNEFVMINADNSSFVNINFEWVADPLPIAGQITDQRGNPVPNVGILVKLENSTGSVKTNTGADGRFSVDNFPGIGKNYKDKSYTVEMESIPAGYTKPIPTANSWSWNFCKNPNPGTQPFADTTTTDEKYQCQKEGSLLDCAGPDLTGTIGRCNFELIAAQTPPPINLSYLCGPNNNTATLFWGSADGRSYKYDVRVNGDGASFSRRDCGGPSGVCVNGYDQNNITINLKPGVKYDWWVHSVNMVNQEGELSRGESFTCGSPVQNGSDDSSSSGGDTTTTTPTLTIPSYPLGPTSTVALSPQCSILNPAGSQVNAISIGEKRVDFSSFATLIIKIDPTGTIVPINVAYSNGACKGLTMAFKYDPNSLPSGGAITPTPTPDPKLCTQNSDRPNGCTCTTNNQCANNKCDPLKGICASDPFIQTSGGDVHSQEEIKGR